MARAICTRCGREVRWRAGRGARLAGLRCPACGGALRSPQAGALAGRTYVRCVVCGRRRMEGSRSLVRPPVPYRALDLDGRPGPHPAGAPACWHHRLVDAHEGRALNGQASLLTGEEDGAWPPSGR